MKNEIIISILNRDSKRKDVYYLDIMIEGRTLTILSGRKDKIQPIYNEIVDTIKTIPNLEDGYGLEITPYNGAKNPFMRGYQHNFYIKEENATTNS